MSTNNSSTDSPTVPEENKSRRQSRLDQVNQLSTANAAVQRVRRKSRSSEDQPKVIDHLITSEFSKLRSAETPAETPEETPSTTPPHGPSRDQSRISLSSMVRQGAMDTPGVNAPVSNVQFPVLETSNPHIPMIDADGEAGPSMKHAIVEKPHLPRHHTSVTFAKGTKETNSAAKDSRNPPEERPRATTLDVPGLTRSKVSPDGRISRDDVGAKLVIVMVGLPARGKSYITKKLARFLNWQQHDCRIFNVGNTRRRASKSAGPAKGPLPSDGENREKTEHEGDFFSPYNPKSVAQREKWAEDTLSELLDYVLDGDGSVGILDATNTTRFRRKRVLSIINERSNGRLRVLFLESICTQRYIIESNVRLKLSGPDYKHMDTEKAIEDFLLRLKNYEQAYEPISSEEEADPSFQYIKFINVGQKFECGNIKGFLAGQTVFFLLNFNLRPRQIWITRHGESTDNQLGKIGGDAGLTERGKKYSAALARFMQFKKKEFQKRLVKERADQLEILKGVDSQPPTPENEREEQNFCVWASMLRRTVETASYFEESEFDLKEMRMLNELDPGICDGMTYQEIKEQYPNEYEARMLDKIRYRYPGISGESYLDVINRLRPVIVEIERMEDNCMVICHRVVARILLSYFMNLGRDAIGDLEVPLHTLYVLEPKPYGVDWALYKYNERLDWFHEMSPEDAQVRSQLNDHKRRYTVVATADMKLGECSPMLKDRPPPESTENAIDSGSSDDDAEHDNDLPTTGYYASDNGGLVMRSRRHPPEESLEKAVEKRLAM